MVPTHPSRTPVLRSTLFALVLAIATVAVAVGRDASAETAFRPSSDGGGTSPSVVVSVPAAPLRVASRGADPGPRYDGRIRPVATALARVVGAPTRSIKADPKPKPQRAKTANSKATTAREKPRPKRAAYRGRNHVWMPSLGIDRSISFYSCSNASYPGNHVYRWGCAGSNNVYLFGHAGSVFKPLHDAYVRGRLRKGAALYYADGSGRVHTYKVAWWKLTTATKGTWAYQALSAPGLTLQTCIGAESQYRLIVRLTEVG